jgi:hypothetical protein
MIREAECHVGMIVRFGRPNGQITRGEIVKCNRTTAQVRSLEVRGTGRGSHIGSTWKVPYSMMTPDTQTAGVASQAYTPAPPVTQREEPLEYSQFRDRAENLAIEAIYITYCHLEPEFLTADGERPLYQINALRHKYSQRLAYLFKVVGRTVTEKQAYEWYKQMREAVAPAQAMR